MNLGNGRFSLILNILPVLDSFPSGSGSCGSATLIGVIIPGLRELKSRLSISGQECRMKRLGTHLSRPPELSLRPPMLLHHHTHNFIYYIEKATQHWGAQKEGRGGPLTVLMGPLAPIFEHEASYFYSPSWKVLKKIGGLKTDSWAGWGRGKRAKRGALAAIYSGIVVPGQHHEQDGDKEKG